MLRPLNGGLVVCLFMVGCGKADTNVLAKVKRVCATSLRVEVFRLDGKNGPFDNAPKLAGEVRICGYLVTKQEPDMSGEFGQQLGQVLCNEELYAQKAAGCFTPGVAFRVWSAGESIDILICFQCSNLFYGPVLRNEIKTKSFLKSPLSKHLVGITKEAFPADKEIQALPE